MAIKVDHSVAPEKLAAYVEAKEAKGGKLKSLTASASVPGKYCGVWDMPAAAPAGAQATEPDWS